MPAIADIRIVFMGTPDFAVPTLQMLVENGCNVVGVITAPDKPAGRGMQLQASQVKAYAREAGLPVLQPEKLRDPGFLAELASLNADLQIVVAFRMLPEVVWSMPSMGTINLHASLLPQYRGAAPINWAIIGGESVTGLTTFKLQHAIDTGNILLQQEMPIGPTEDAGSLHDRMQAAGARLVLETVKGLSDGSLQEKPQPQPAATHLKPAPKIFKDTCRIDFNKPVREVYNLIRGLSPFPAAFTELDGRILKIYQAHIETIDASDSPQAPGLLLTDAKTYLKFSCPDGNIVVEYLQLAGKKKMAAIDFLRGYHFEK